METHRLALHTSAAITRYSKCKSKVDEVDWTKPCPDYAPVEFTAPDVDGPHLELNERPRNPRGRTGMTGRGVLHHYGANQAVDPLVVRVHEGKFQLVVIMDEEIACLWALPGGRMEAGESVNGALLREFAEEALDSDKAMMSILYNTFKEDGLVIYRGYVDDPRNTDNAWLETTCVLYFLTEHRISSRSLVLKSGSDACDVKWLDLPENFYELDTLDFYADHLKFVKKAFALVHTVTWPLDKQRVYIPTEEEQIWIEKRRQELLFQGRHKMTSEQYAKWYVEKTMRDERMNTQEMIKDIEKTVTRYMNEYKSISEERRRRSVNN